ncbi:MAG: hypothetical protein HeimC2_20440 [Candidatus Heimdallarchaeota archaeon LC_2]|nr:MAG: hypothetical protein HeimC2_20440 [Candidatus Heimdallarchaeota archaeon LC_2]
MVTLFTNELLTPVLLAITLYKPPASLLTGSLTAPASNLRGVPIASSRGFVRLASQVPAKSSFPPTQSNLLPLSNHFYMATTSGFSTLSNICKPEILTNSASYPDKSSDAKSQISLFTTEIVLSASV